MKKILYVTLLFVPALALAAADDSDNSKLHELKKEWAQTVDALQDYTAEKRNNAIRTAKQTLDAVDKQINKLERRTSENWHTLNDKARASKQASLERMRKMRNNLSAWLGAMQHSTKESWTDVKMGFIDAYQELSESFREAAVDSDASEQASNY